MSLPLALVLDDSELLAWQLCQLLRKRGLQAEWVVDEAALLSALPGAALVCVELQLLRGNGFQWLRRLQALAPSLPLLLLSGTGRATDRAWALRAGAAGLLQRPVDESGLAAMLRQLHLGQGGGT